jgi:ferrous iron transport protein B
LIAAFIPPHRCLGGWITFQGLTLTGLYVLGIVAAVLAALILKRTLLRGEAPLFIMELPSYKWPTPRTVIQRAVERAWRFVRDAGTIILAVSIVVWAALYFPRNTDGVEAPYRPQREKLESELALLPETDPRRTDVEAELRRIEHEIAGAHQRQSFLGQAGRFVEPVFRPLGWDWRISCAVLASFPAREVVVATLGVTYNLGDEADAESEEGLTQFQARLKQATWDGTDRKVFTVPVALSIMVFFALCAQCAATLAVIRRETNSWRWPLFSFAYMTSLAYVAALVTYQVGTRIAGLPI